MTQAGYSVGNLNDLRAVAPNQRTNGALRFVFEKKAWYVFDANSTVADDNNSAIAPDEGTGGWIMQAAAVNGGGTDPGLQSQVDALSVAINGGIDANGSFVNGLTNDLSNLQSQVNNLPDWQAQIDQLQQIIDSKLSNLEYNVASALNLIAPVPSLVPPGTYDAAVDQTTFEVQGTFSAWSIVELRSYYQPVVPVSIVHHYSPQSGYSATVVVAGNITNLIAYVVYFQDRAAFATELQRQSNG